MTKQKMPLGHDAPVIRREEDDYDRWPIATSITNVISSSPLEWSTRIGLYGRWGEGKSSVLNFLEAQQIERGNIVIKFSPWGASTEAQVWADFGKQLKKGLEENGIPIKFWAKHWYSLKQNKQSISRVVKGAGAVAPALTSGAIPKAAAEVTASFIEKNLAISKEDIERISSALDKKRLIVFIDDLDRTDPSVIPKVMLTLRELLDYSKFVFVLAFDKKVVASSLSEYNKAWGENGEVFIEKVIDFPFDLPNPSVHQVEKLAKRQFKNLCPFVPLQSLDGILHLLPRSPRKLKLFARIISSKKLEAERHEEGELDWQTIFIFTLLRMESDQFTNIFIEKICETENFVWSTWLTSKDAGEAEDKQLEEIFFLLSDIKDEAKDRIKKLVHVWRALTRFGQGERIRYQAYFAIRPHNITWGEFRDFFQLWRGDKSARNVSKFISARAKDMHASLSSVAAEFVDTLINHYAYLLERAGETKDGASHLELINEAKDCLELLELLFRGEVKDVTDKIRASLSWHRIYSVCASWQHFNANYQEPELRFAERKLLTSVIPFIENKLEAYELLKPWDDDYWMFDGRAGELKRDFHNHLIHAFEPFVAEVGLVQFKSIDGLRGLFGSDDHIGLQYLFCSPDSPLFTSDCLQRFTDIILSGKESLNTRRSTTDFLELQLRSLNHNGKFCSKEEREKFIVKFTDLFVDVWNVITSQRYQYRYLSSLREKREKLISCGIPKEKLEVPNWLKISGAAEQG